jgi:predicted N-acetyltransferase YhbS
VGYLLLTEVEIIGRSDNKTALALAPLAVLPGFQRKGIGRALIEVAHAQARETGHGAIFVLGDPGYYRKFGYLETGRFDITLPFDVPEAYCMVIELTADYLKGCKGEVRYTNAFFQ